MYLDVDNPILLHLIEIITDLLVKIVPQMILHNIVRVISKKDTINRTYVRVESIWKISCFKGLYIKRESKTLIYIYAPLCTPVVRFGKKESFNSVVIHLLGMLQ